MEQNNSKTNKFLLVLLLIVVVIALGFLSYNYRTQIKRFLGFATVTDPFLLRAIDQNWTTTGHAWGENIGWVSFQEENAGVYVGDYELLGYAWGENVGWISLNCLNTNSCGTVNYAVANDGEGHLSGYAWGENIGWVDFHPTNGGVVIHRDGVIDGYAWGENVGWINFEATGNATTNWRHQSDRPQCNNGLDDDGDSYIDFPKDPSCTDILGTQEDYKRRRIDTSTALEEGGDSTDVNDLATTSQQVATSTGTTTSQVSTSTPTTAPAGDQPTTKPGVGGTTGGQTGVEVTFTGKFTRDLTVGSVGDDVVELQKFLNNNGFIVANSGVGAPGEETSFFGNRTKDALKKFQEANASSILTPVGLTKGTGYFGGATRAFVNALLVK
jgi:hypothetical protein